MNNVSAAGDGSPQGQVEAGSAEAAPPAAEPDTPRLALDASPVTVLSGPPDAVPGEEAEPPVRHRPRVRAEASRKAEESGTSPVTNRRRRRTGVALATATGVVALAAAPFAVVSPHVQILGDSSSSPAAQRPQTEAKKQAGRQTRKNPVVPVPAPVPSWQPRHSPPQAPARPPRVKLSPSKDAAEPGGAEKPATRPEHEDKAKPLAHRPAARTRPESAPERAPEISKLVVSPKKDTDATEHHAAVRTNAVEKTLAAPNSAPSKSPSEQASEQASRAPAQTRIINGTYVLNPGESVGTNRIRLSLRSDGDLVLSDQDGKAVWSSGTHAQGTHAVFQADGNFVLYSSDDATLWSSRTDGHDGAVLVLQSDGNLTIRQGDTTLWASGT
ncbi:hypothetical protein [Actinomadura sp. DC4]|uniref:hypothetical protein n=1 Tax=Actinomadura sp. DC4 TaxID=3055069 RepID=UPI0025B19A4F|nr:hypothetical protein [Actinomadura sp. DC4]MDN3359238.1 hypothetical protein [Actinomadura sp. DC4]